MEGYTFSMPSKTYTRVVRDISSQNFTATQQMFKISDVVNIGETPLAGATITASSDGGTTITSTTTTNSNGVYTIEVPYNWSGEVIPTFPGIIFDPPSKSYFNVLGNYDMGQLEVPDAPINILPDPITPTPTAGGTQNNTSVDVQNPNTQPINLQPNVDPTAPTPVEPQPAQDQGIAAALQFYRSLTDLPAPLLCRLAYQRNTTNGLARMMRGCKPFQIHRRCLLLFLNLGLVDRKTSLQLRLLHRHFCPFVYLPALMRELNSHRAEGRTY